MYTDLGFKSYLYLMEESLTKLNRLNNVETAFQFNHFILVRLLRAQQIKDKNVSILAEPELQ